jgi:hypothetical protein
MFVSLASREIEAAQTWSASGVNDAYHSPLTGKEIMHSMCFAIAWPNYTALLGKTTDNMRRRQALIKAMELELQRRAKRQQTFELPYDAEHHIVVKPEYGCIVKNEGGQ